MTSKDFLNQTDDPVEFVRQNFIEIKQRNQQYSLRSFAKKLGCTTSTISRVFSGKRKLTTDLAIKWLPHFDLNESEKNFFAELILFYKTKI